MWNCIIPASEKNYTDYLNFHESVILILSMGILNPYFSDLFTYLSESQYQLNYVSCHFKTILASKSSKTTMLRTIANRILNYTGIDEVK